MLKVKNRRSWSLKTPLEISLKYILEWMNVQGLTTIPQIEQTHKILMNKCPKPSLIAFPWVLASIHFESALSWGTGFGYLKMKSFLGLEL